MNILAVDGAIIFSSLLKKMMTDIGEPNLITCSSGRLALAISEKFSADILIMDINLSDMDGLEMVKRLNEINRSIYIIVIIDKQDYERLEEALTIGIDDYILKPLEGKELIVRVKKALYAKESQTYQREQPPRRLPETEVINPEDAAGIRDTKERFKPEEEPYSRPGREQYLENPVPAAAAFSDDTYSSNFFVGSASEEAYFPHHQSSGRTRSGGRKRTVHPRRVSGGNPLTLAARILGNVIFACLLVIVASLAFFLIQSKLAGGIPSVFGYQMYVVLSGSMNPAFDTGSLAFVRPVEPEDIAVDDIITFKGAGGGSILTTHRVVSVNNEAGLTFTTRGDANNVNDPSPVPAANVVGRVHGSVPYLGYLMSFAQTRNGLLLLVVVPGILIIVFEIRNLYKNIIDSQKGQERQRADNITAG